VYYEFLVQAMICNICPLHCEFNDRRTKGLCRVVAKENDVIKSSNDGILEYGIDFIERLGFYHFLPGSEALYVLMPGCNLKCIFCPEWQITHKDPDAIHGFTGKIRPKELVTIAKNHGAESIVFSCNSALNTEYIAKTSEVALKEGLNLALITHGVLEPDYVTHIIRYFKGVLIRFFGFSKKAYAKLTLIPNGYEYAIKMAEMVYQEGVHLEISYTIIPGINDSKNEINDFLEWVMGFSSGDIPLHFKRYYPAYLLADKAPTRTKALKDAFRLAKKHGLKYAYADDIFEGSERVTECPKDGEPLIIRIGDFVLVKLGKGNKCPRCGEIIPIYGTPKNTLNWRILKFRTTT